MKLSDLTVAIVTYKRPEKLKRCLESIGKQTKLPKQVLIVDNDSAKSAQKVANKFRKKLPIKYAVEQKRGIPYARNKVLRLCRTKYLGFVDDDCVLDSKWVEVGTKAIKDAKSAYVLGKTLLLNKESVAQAQHARHLRWFFYKFNGRATSPFSVDTKNIIFLAEMINNEEFLFDKNMSVEGYDSSDTDLGLQLKKAGLKGFYEDKMIVYHQETNDFLGFIKKAYYRGTLAAKINHKWKLKGEFVDLSERNFLKWFWNVRIWPKDFKRYQGILEGNVAKKIETFILIKCFDRIFLQGFLDESKSKGPS